MKLRVGILLAGCGAIDGSDPQETVLLQLAFQELGHETVCLSLDAPQFHVADHTTTLEISDYNRNQFQESQRLVRGKLHQLCDIAPALLDILVIPGGQGPIKSWLSAASADEPRVLHPEIETFLRAFRAKGGILGVVSLSEFIATALEGEWADGRGALDLAPEETFVEPDKGRALCPGNLSARDLPQLQAGIRRFAKEVADLAKRRA